MRVSTEGIILSIALEKEAERMDDFTSDGMVYGCGHAGQVKH